MSTENTGVSDTTIVTSGENSPELEKIKAHSQKLLSELKQHKAKVAELELKEQERANALLAEQGKFKEAFDAQLAKTKLIEDDFKAKEKAFADKIFTREVKDAALKFGARQDALDDIVKIGDWSGVSVDDSYNVDHEQLKAQIANLSKSKSFLFSGSASAPRTVNTSSGGAPATGKKIEEMSAKEIEDQIRALDAK